LSDWKCAGKSFTGNDYDAYIVADQDADERIDLGNDAWLLVRDVDGLTKHFAVFEFLAKSDDTTEHIMIFHGTGPSGGLRECRHIYWGEGGYTFCLRFALVEAAFRELRRWYDGD
jgi:hypothetical protein